MEPSRLAENMAAAHAARAQRAVAELNAMNAAPAFFKAERVEQVSAEYVAARAEVGRWLA